jgi:hypothetical protein
MTFLASDFNARLTAGRRRKVWETPDSSMPPTEAPGTPAPEVQETTRPPSEIGG